MALTQRDWVNDEAPAIDAIYLNELDDEVRRLDTAKVGLSGNETINGIKTFNSSPIVPTPTTDYQVATKEYVDNSFIVEVDAGDNLNYSDDELETSTNTSYVELKAVVVPFTGTIKVYFKVTREQSITVYGRIYVNGVAVGAERQVGSYFENISVNYGDRVSIYVKSTYSHYPVGISDFRIYTDKILDFIKVA